jgi:uncharacterized membrane protein
LKKVAMQGQHLQGIRRKIVYVTLFESIAILVCSAGYALGSGRGVEGLGHASALSVVTSAIAILWNLTFNHAFEWWESRQRRRGRSLARRVTHAALFEAGLTLALVPLIMGWLSVDFWLALAMDFGLSAFFLVYAFVFTWAFDRVFGLPRAVA